MELSPEGLRATARLWDAVAADLDDAARILAGAPTAGLDGATSATTAFLAAAGRSLHDLRRGATAQVDALLTTARLVTEVDDRVATVLSRAARGADP